MYCLTTLQVRQRAQHADVLAQAAELKLGEAAQALLRLRHSESALAQVGLGAGGCVALLQCEGRVCS